MHSINNCLAWTHMTLFEITDNQPAPRHTHSI